jgi:hypothetical protein
MMDPRSLISASCPISAWEVKKQLLGNHPVSVAVGVIHDTVVHKRQIL